MLGPACVSKHDWKTMKQKSQRLYLQIILVACGFIISSCGNSDSDSTQRMTDNTGTAEFTSTEYCSSAVSEAASSYAQCLSHQLQVVLVAGGAGLVTDCDPKLAEQVLRLRRKFADERGVNARICGLDSASIRTMAAGIRQAMGYVSRLQRADQPAYDIPSLSLATPAVKSAEFLCANAGSIWASDTGICSDIDLTSVSPAAKCDLAGGSWNDTDSVCSEASRCQKMGFCGPCGYGSDNIPGVLCTSSTISDFSCDASLPEMAQWRAGVGDFTNQQDQYTTQCEWTYPDGGGYIAQWAQCKVGAAGVKKSKSLCEAALPNYDAIVLPPPPPAISDALPPGSWPASCQAVSWVDSTLCADCATAASLIQDSYSCASCSTGFENLLGILACTSE